MDSSIHNVKEVRVTSRELEDGLGMSTRIKVSTCHDGNEIEEVIILFSNGKLINSFNGKSVPHQKKDK
jgi:hypothetical protein